MQAIPAVLVALLALGINASAQTSVVPNPAPATCAAAPVPTVTEASRAMAAGDPARAEELFTADVATSPTAVNFAGLVASQLQQNKLTEASVTADRAIAALPKSADAQALVGETLIRAGKIPEASAAYTKALALDRCSAAVHLGYARLNDLTSKHATAAREYGLAHTLAPKDPEVTAAFLLNLPGNLPADKRVAAFHSFLAASPMLPPETLERLAVASAILEQHRTCTPVELDAKASIDLYGIMLIGTKPRSWGIKSHIDNADLPLLELDSSVSGIVLNPADARKAGVRPLLASPIPANAPYYAVADHIRIGSAEYRDCTIRVAPAAQLANAYSIIGTDFFRDRLINVNYVTKQITLTPYAKDPGASAPEPGAPTNRFISLQQKDWSAAYIAGGNILIPTLLNKKGPYLFALDTGSVDTIFAPNVNREILFAIRESDINIHGFSGTIVKAIPKAGGSDDDHAVVTGPDGKFLKVSQPVKVPFLTFANNEYATNAGVSYDITPKSHDLGLEVSGLIGFVILRDFYIDLDYRDGLVRLKYDLDHLYQTRELSPTTRPN